MNTVGVDAGAGNISTIRQHFHNSWNGPTMPGTLARVLPMALSPPASCTATSGGEQSRLTSEKRLGAAGETPGIPAHRLRRSLKRSQRSGGCRRRPPGSTPPRQPPGGHSGPGWSAVIVLESLRSWVRHPGREGPMTMANRLLGQAEQPDAGGLGHRRATRGQPSDRLPTKPPPVLQTQCAMARVKEAGGRRCLERRIRPDARVLQTQCAMARVAGAKRVAGGGGERAGKLERRRSSEWKRGTPRRADQIVVLASAGQPSSCLAVGESVIVLASPLHPY